MLSAKIKEGVKMSLAIMVFLIVATAEVLSMDELPKQQSDEKESPIVEGLIACIERLLGRR